MHNNNSRFASLVDDTSSSHKSVFGKNKSRNNNKETRTTNKETRTTNEETRTTNVETRTTNVETRTTNVETRNNEKKEDIKPDIKIKTSSSNFFKNDRPSFQRDNYRSHYGSNKEYIEMIKKQEQIKKAEEEKRKEEEKLVALSIDSFPELSKVTIKPVQVIIDNTTNFLEKIKTCAKNNDIQVNHIVKPGWREMRLDTNTNKFIIESGIIETMVTKKTIETRQKYLAYKVFDKLVYLHEKRTSEYIKNWGEDEWERTFLFPNYDYHYFDKLDEIYEKNNPNLEEEYEQFSEQEEVNY